MPKILHFISLMMNSKILDVANISDFFLDIISNKHCLILFSSPSYQYKICLNRKIRFEMFWNFDFDFKYEIILNFTDISNHSMDEMTGACFDNFFSLISFIRPTKITKQNIFMNIELYHKKKYNIISKQKSHFMSVILDFIPNGMSSIKFDKKV